MAQVAPSLTQIRAHVQRLRKNAKSNPNLAVGIRSPAKWSGGDAFAVDGHSYDVVWCVGPLEARSRLAEYDVGPRGLVLVTPLDEHQLGADVLARLMRSRLETVRAWDMLLEQFQARQLDPQVATHGWIAEALLSLLPDGGFEAVPAGVLDASTVWKVLLTRKLGIERAPVDLEALVDWTRDNNALHRYAELDDGFRVGLREHLTAACGAAAGAVLNCVDAGYGADAVSLGLICRILFHQSAGNESSFPAGAVRLEKYTLDHPLDPQAGRQWAAAAEAVVRNIQSTEGVNAARAVLARSDQLVSELKASEVVHLSDVLPEGFERRLVRYGSALTAWLHTRSGTDLRALTDAAASVTTHDQAKLQPDRVRRVDMSLRLAQFLSQSPSPEPTRAAPLEQLAVMYAKDGGFVDWGRSVVAGEGRAELADAFTKLAGTVAAWRETQNEQFARSLVAWTASVSKAQVVLPIESVLDEVIAPLAEQAPILLLVIDGMSFAVFRELLDDLVNGSGWVQLERPEFPSGQPVLATIPSVTEFSRTSLLCGCLAQGGQSEAIAGFTTHPGLVKASRNTGNPLLFHKAELSEGAGNDLAAELRKTIASNRRVLGVVINAVDDHLLKGDQVQPRWTVEYIRVLQSLLHEAAMAGRTLILASDHGHVIDRQTEYRESDRGERWRSATGAPRSGELEVQGQRVVADGGRLIALWSERIHFGVKRNGYHGGLAPQEMLAPLAVLVPSTGKHPDGWSESALYQPAWWDFQQAEIAPVVEVAVEAMPAPSVAVKEPKTLFDLPPSSAPAAPSTTPAPMAAPNWLEPLLASTVFENQRKFTGRTPVSDATARSFLLAITSRGGKILRPGLARHLNLPPLRLPGVIAAMRRLLNFDGVDVLSIDEASDSVVLDVERLKVQFDLQ
jgi:hypothetical protein